jgi:hypothetical protein
MTSSTPRLKVLTYIALSCSIVAWTTVFLWINAFTKGTGLAGRVYIYSNYFGSFIGFFIATVAEFALCITSIVVSGVVLKRTAGKWKTINSVVIVASGLRLLLILFGLA